ncbi:hypothetical protein [Halomonas sp. DWK9]|uniref:hypothetical protein n=1 Tax=Halomonas sp. DWK9 TaxID=3060155 RepID=UPI00287F71A8|nr:hypothetical protein [Halomonas sp. DWK9]
MTNRIWMPVVASMALLLSACGDSQEEAAVAPEEQPATTDQASEPAATANEPMAEQPAEPENDTAEDAAPSEVPSPSEVEDEIEARQAAEELEQAEAMREEGTDASAVMPDETLQADAETLAADPDDALDEASAMPGETTRSDVDEVIAETERRFEEAQRQLEQQFQEIEQQTPELEPMENDSLEPSWEREGSVSNSTALEGELEATDVDALIEDTERQFEEAQQRLEEQFQALENEQPANGMMLDGNDEVNRDESPEESP